MAEKLFAEQDFYGRDSEWDLPKGFMFGGLPDLVEDNLQAYAAQFMTAADVIIDAIYKNQIEDFKVSNPVLYLYRHAVELYLKNILRNQGEEIQNNHSLHSLADKVSSMPCEVKDIVMQLHALDPRSTAYRYNSNRPVEFPDESFCDAGNLKTQMRLLRSYFEGSSHD